MNLLDLVVRRKLGRLHPGDRCPESGQYTWSQELWGKHV
jgi:hypothetical protein